MSNSKLRIHFVLEGNEENTLFEIIEELYVMENIKMTYKNSNGGGNIPSYYQAALASDNYDFIYCVYDVDYSPNDEKAMYKRIRNGLYKVLGDEKEIDNVSLCINPNTLLIILLGYDELSALIGIKSDKKQNTALINKYCPKIGNKKDYDASRWQLDIFKDDYIYSKKASIDKILEALDEINMNYEDNGVGSNLLPVIEALIKDDYSFFEKKMED